MELEVESLIGAAHGERSADRLPPWPSLLAAGRVPDPCRDSPGICWPSLARHRTWRAAGFIGIGPMRCRSMPSFLLSIDSHVSRNDPRGTHQRVEHHAYTLVLGV
jgi:hypothetical protein